MNCTGHTAASHRLTTTMATHRQQLDSTTLSRSTAHYRHPANHPTRSLAAVRQQQETPAILRLTRDVHSHQLYYGATIGNTQLDTSSQTPPAQADYPVCSQPSTNLGRLSSACCTQHGALLLPQPDIALRADTDPLLLSRTQRNTRELYQIDHKSVTYTASLCTAFQLDISFNLNYR